MISKISETIMGSYFRFHPQDMIPIYTAIFMLALFIGIVILLNFLIKKYDIEKKKGERIKLAFNLLFPILFFLVLEFSVVFSVEKINSQQPEKIFQIDPLLFWKIGSKRVNRKWGTGTFSTNSQGIRADKEIPYKKKNNEYRTLVLGDSWAFGQNVDNDQTYSHILEKKLAPLYPDKEITVINGGCPAYSIAQGYFFLTFRGIKYDPDMVIVKNFYSRRMLLAYIKIYPQNSSAILRNFKHILWKSNVYLYLRRMFFIRYAADSLPQQKGLVKNEVIKYIMWMLKEMDKFCEEKKITTIYLNMELKDETLLSREFRKFSTEEKSNYLELSLDPAIDPEYYQFDPYHPGPKNHRIIGEKLSEYIKENKLIKERR